MTRPGNKPWFPWPFENTLPTRQMSRYYTWNIYIYIYIYNSVVRPARIYIHPPCKDTGCSLEDQPKEMANRDRGRENESQGTLSLSIRLDDDDDGIYIYIYKWTRWPKLADRSRVRPEGFLFNIHYTEVSRRAVLLSLDMNPGLPGHWRTL